MKESAPNLLSPYGIHCQTILRNASPAILYEEALLYETDSAVSDTGALIVSSSEKTGRSPKDKRIVTTPEVNRLTGGRTPKASQVRNRMLSGCPPRQGINEFSIYSIG